MTSGGFLVRKGLDASRDPIELVHSEHLMMREVLDAIDRLVLEPSGRSPEAALELYGFLRDEYLAHHLDEDEALFPLLRKRAEPEDRIDEILDRLEADHETGNGLIDKILGILKAFIKNEASLRDEDFETLRFFAASERRHLIVENAIILPIARARLTKADLDGIYNRMLARRGLDRVTSGKAT
jgi:hemerythrin-like domain-containing protein